MILSPPARVRTPPRRRFEAIVRLARPALAWKGLLEPQRDAPPAVREAIRPYLANHVPTKRMYLQQRLM